MANLRLHILPNLDLYMIMDGAFLSKIHFIWTQMNMNSSKGYPKSVCSGRVGESCWTSKKIEGLWQRISRILILYLEDFCESKKTVRFILRKPWNLLQKPHNMEDAGPFIPSGNASSSRSSLAPLAARTTHMLPWVRPPQEQGNQPPGGNLTSRTESVGVL